MEWTSRHLIHGYSDEEHIRDPGQTKNDVPRQLALVFAWMVSVGVAAILGCAVGQSSSQSRTVSGDISAASSLAEAPAAPSGFYSLYESHIKTAKHIDLTHTISPTTPVWYGFGPSSVTASKAGAKILGFVEMGDEFTYAKHGFQATQYHLVTDQLGTQLDPPAHWNELGATISDLPATFALRPLVVIDIHDKVSANSSYHANVSDLLAWETKHGRVPAGSVVMIRSDWYKGWEGYAENLPSTYPGVNLDLLKLLHNDRQILFHGHEPLDTDMTATLEGEAWLMHNNFAQAEGVSNLDQVPETGCLISIGFAKLQGGTGGYARFVAICPPDTPQGASVTDVAGAPLPTQTAPLRRNEKGVLQPTPGAAPTAYCAKGSAALGCNGEKSVWD